jgi:putative hemolysin
MKKIVVAAALTLMAGCAERPAPAEPEQNHAVGMANPASVYCKKLGGTLDTVKEPAGEAGYCTLPSGERIEEWALFRRDHSE